MPNFAIDGSSPSQISQTGTQAALIRNTGSSVVFLDAYSSVSESNYGLELQPLDSVNWAEGRDLWAVCSAGNQSTLSVLYGADGVSLGAVSAVVTGDVTATIDGPVEANIQGTVPVDIQNAVINADVTGNIVVDSGEVNVGGILTPVSVQGGGESLLSFAGNINGGQTVTHTIPAPPSGITYYGLRISFANTQLGGGLVPLYVRARFGSNVVTDVLAAAMDGVTPAAQVGRFGNPSRITFTTPNTAGYPVTILVTNPTGNPTRSYGLDVEGIAQSLPYPIDSVEWASTSDTRVSLSGTVANDYVLIAPSFVDRVFRISTGVGTTAARFNVEVMSVAFLTTPTFQQTHSDVQTNYYGGVPPTLGVVANTSSAFIIPGNGRPHRVVVNVPPTGSSIGLEYVGRVST